MEESEALPLLIHFPMCYLCKRILDKRSYCTNCTETRRLATEKMSALANIKEQNYQLSHDTVKNAILLREQFTKLRVLKEKYQRKISFLKEKITQVQTISKKEKVRKEELKKRIEKGKSSFSSLRNLCVEDINSSSVGEKIRMEEKKKTIEEKKEILNKLQEKLKNHRKYIIVELLSFFPLNPLSENEHTIVNIKLLNNYTHWIDLPNEAVAAALGYIVHILTVAASYLYILFPYSFRYVGSRSLIWNPHSSKQYILYNNHENEEEFRIATDMLNWNVIHFCRTQGIIVADERKDLTLPNLLAALRSPSLGSIVPFDYNRSPNHSYFDVKRRSVSISSANNEASAITSNGVKTDTDEEFVVIETIPPPPSSDEDILHFERAMFIDKV